MNIPIRNIWLLQLYASSLYRSLGPQPVASEDNPENLPDLAARILADQVTVRLHTGLSVGFRQTQRAVTRVRGRINTLLTERQQLMLRGQVHCSFDEITTDTPANRLIKAALERAAVLVPHGARYRSLALQLGAAGVRGPCPPLSAATAMQRERLLVRDRTMIAAAELLLTFTIPTTLVGRHHLPAPAMDDHYLRKLFERAMYGFYRHRLTPQGWVVKHGQHLKWPTSAPSSGILAILPGMEIDIALRHSDPHGWGPRLIVIDTKFTSVTKPGQYGQDRLSSGYVYQIYAYLMSQHDDEPTAEGLMLHPSIGTHVDEEVVIQGHRIRFATVDLARSPADIASHLLSAISP